MAEINSDMILTMIKDIQIELKQLTKVIINQEATFAKITEIEKKLEFSKRELDEYDTNGCNALAKLRIDREAASEKIQLKLDAVNSRLTLLEDMRNKIFFGVFSAIGVALLGLIMR